MVEEVLQRTRTEGRLSKYIRSVRHVVPPIQPHSIHSFRLLSFRFGALINLKFSWQCVCVRYVSANTGKQWIYLFAHSYIHPSIHRHHLAMLLTMIVLIRGPLKVSSSGKFLDRSLFDEHLSYFGNFLSFWKITVKRKVIAWRRYNENFPIKLSSLSLLLLCFHVDTYWSCPLTKDEGRILSCILFVPVYAESHR